MLLYAPPCGHTRTPQQDRSIDRLLLAPSWWSVFSHGTVRAVTHWSTSRATTVTNQLAGGSHLAGSSIGGSFAASQLIIKMKRELEWVPPPAKWYSSRNTESLNVLLLLIKYCLLFYYHGKSVSKDVLYDYNSNCSFHRFIDAVQ